MKRWIVLMALGTARLAAQQPATTTLKPVNGTLNGPFVAWPLNDRLAHQRQLHELSDGRVLMVDDTLRGTRVIVADFGTGKVDALSGLPKGDLVPLPGDSTLGTKSDGWHFLVGLREIGMLPPTNPLVTAVQHRPVRGADDQGHILIDIPQQGLSDSNAVMLFDRATGDAQMVAKVAVTKVERGMFRATVCLMDEPALLTSDGWIAILRANPYRVDWRNPGGQWILGTPIPTAVVPMTPREEQVYLEWRERERPTTPNDAVRSWPATVCPWTSGYRPLATPDGKLVVYRVPMSEAPSTRYDVIDRQGKLERQIAMPASDAIIGFGRNSVYTVTTDSGKQTISRRPWP